MPGDGSTSIAINGAAGGRTFDGVAAISGGGGNSRLLVDYPEPQRTQILDYLFKPGYGSAVQLLKIEIGGDANSTDGSEPSVEHTKGAVNCDAGYEFWLAEQAKAAIPASGWQASSGRRQAGSAAAPTTGHRTPSTTSSRG
ncbi:hypothetical protein J5X84_44215 [Streptosporangiaceae bacterium NEAU-GS5]|nr:hypothetical protein [Streptosporangiaceae bacterium NEAU-GS5]